MEVVNKSGDLKTKFIELSEEYGGRYLKLKTIPVHRWGCADLVLERLLLVCTSLDAAFAADTRQAAAVFPLTDSDRTVITEF